MWQWFVRNWLQNLAREKIQQTVVQAAQDQLASTVHQAEAAALDQTPADVGVIFAVENESGGLEDLIQGRLATKAGGFVFAHGMLHDRRVVIVRSGAGRRAAAQATRLLLDVHRPAWVISSGFAGSLTPGLERGELVAADEVLGPDGPCLAVDPRMAAAGLTQGVRLHVGRMLTVDRVVRTAEEKHSLGLQHRAMAVDMESLAVAEVCQERQTRFLAIRVVFDAVDDALPDDVERLVRQRTSAARWGAALGAIVNRPGSIKDMYNLKERALVNADRLAKFLARMIAQVPAGPETALLPDESSPEGRGA